MKLKRLELNLRARISPHKEKLMAHVKSEFFRDTVTQFLLIPSVFLLLTSWILAIYYFKVSDYLVPQRYNSFLGVFSLGPWHASYLIPMVLTTCFLANVILAKSIYQKDKFLGYILVASNIFLAILTPAIIFNFGKLIGN